MKILLYVMLVDEDSIEKEEDFGRVIDKNLAKVRN